MKISSSVIRSTTRIRSLIALLILTVLGSSWVVLRADVPQVASGTWAAAGEVVVPSGAVSVTLADGRVVVAGGKSDGTLSPVIASYDPASGAWARVGELLTARSGHAMTLLNDGRVLIAGGTASYGPTFDIEIFDPATGTSVHAGDMTLARVDHAAATLKDGRVLIVGGSDGVAPMSLAEMFDPATGQTQGVANAMSTARVKATATTMIDGHVLVVGGNDGANDLASAEIFEPATGSFFDTGAMQVARSGHVAVLLPNNNQVLIAGGMSAGTAVASAELYADWRDGFSASAPMSAPRLGAIAGGLQPHDIAFVAGGGANTGDYYGYATVKTDKDDYWPGEPVTVTGSGWQPGETVVLTISEDADTHYDFIYRAVADEAGNITNSEFAPIQNEIFQHFGKRFYVTARGAASRALNTFTDGNGKITGRILDKSTNLGIAGATITCSSGCDLVDGQKPTATSTGPLGEYSLGKFNFSGSEKTVKITVSAFGYEPQEEDFTFRNDTVEFDWKLVPSVVATKPVITWANPADITYGTLLSATQLNATANVAGSFVYTPAAGAKVNAGANELSVTFTPTDTAKYTTASATVDITVLQATPVITWANPANITYGTLLSATQLNATADVAGSFAYTPAAGEKLNAGANQTLSVVFTPTDTVNYTTQTKSVTITVLQAKPVITWANPADIVYGTALSATQLNATANVDGSFEYTPAAGAVLNADANQTLSVTFTPTDAANYTTASKSVAITVQKATPVVTWTPPADIVYGTALSTTQLKATANVDGSFNYAPAAGAVLNAGANQTLSVTFTPTDAANYTTASKSVAITVQKATPVVTWTTPADIVYGTALSTTQLNANANVDGSFNYAPAAGAVLNAGPNQTLSVTFTPTDAANYTTASKSVAITVHKATPVLTWLNPADIIYGTALSATQLNATADAEGSFVYTPADGVKLNAGPNQQLSVAFAPTDAANYTTANAAVNITVLKATPAVTVNGGTYTFNGQTHPATATATGVTGNVSGTFTFTYNGAAAEPVNAGTYAVVANFTSSDANYKDATETGSITIEQATPTVTVNGGTYTFNGQTHPATATATGVTGKVPGTFTFTYNGAAAEPVNAGTYVVVANFTSSDANYKDATETGSITIEQATPTVTVNGGTYTFNGQTHPATATATGVTGNVPGTFTFTYNGAAAGPVNAGTYAVVANFTSSDANYKGTTGIGSILITRASQTIVVTTPAPASGLYNTAFTVAASGGESGNPVTFSAAGSCTNVGVTFTMTSGYGTCQVTFNQEGNSNYYPAEPVVHNVGATPWKLTGFYQPVTSSAPGSPVWNVVKGGSTVPLKFQIFAGVNGPEQTSVSAIKSMLAQPVVCAGGAAIDVQANELTNTGGTTLRYDGSQFIQNWKTAKTPGTCFLVTMQAIDGSTLSAYFQVK